MRGYNQNEVDDFLDLVVRDYEELTQRNRELEKQSNILKKNLSTSMN